MDTATTTKRLGQPIDGEAAETTVTCPAGHQYGLYAYGIRNDFCRKCEYAKAQAGGRGAQKRLWRLDDLHRKAKRAQQFAEDLARRKAVGPRGARWEVWEERSAKGF